MVQWVRTLAVKARPRVPNLQFPWKRPEMCTGAYNPSIGVGAQTGFPELIGRPASPVEVISPSERAYLEKGGAAQQRKTSTSPSGLCTLTWAHTTQHGPACAQSASHDVIRPLCVFGAFSSGRACFTPPPPQVQLLLGSSLGFSHVFLCPIPVTSVLLELGQASVSLYYEHPLHQWSPGQHLRSSFG